VESSTRRQLESITFYFGPIVTPGSAHLLQPPKETWGPARVRSPWPLKVIFPIGCGVSKVVITYKPPPLSAWERLALDEPWAHKPQPAKEEVYEVVAVESATTMTIQQTTGPYTNGVTVITGITGFNIPVTSTASTSNLPLYSGTMATNGNGNNFDPFPGYNGYATYPYQETDGPHPRNRREGRILNALGSYGVWKVSKLVNQLRARDRTEWNALFWQIVTRDLTQHTRWDIVSQCMESQEVPFRRRTRRKHLPSFAT
jgi:hypothetical protein